MTGRVKQGRFGHSGFTWEAPVRLATGSLLALASVAMLTSVISQNVTVAGGQYRGVFFISIAALVAAGCCCWAVFRRGGRARWVALLIALPSVLVVLDWLRRLPYLHILG